MGAVTDIGADVPSFWKGLTEGRSGIRPIQSFTQDMEWGARIAGEIDFTPPDTLDQRELKRMDRYSVLGMIASEEAANDCGIDFKAGDPYRRGVVIGSGIGGILTIEIGLDKLRKTGPRKVSPFTVPKLMANACAGNVSIRHNLRGVNCATCTACATGAHAIGTAYNLIRFGEADVIIAGGAEASVTPLCIAAFRAMKALSTRNDEPEKASRPFDRDRDGFVLAEGAAVVVLEALEDAKARGARIYAELCGFASTSDSHHIAAPEPNGTGALKAMEFALQHAGLNPEQVDYINTHGTSTPLGDSAEVQAIKRCFGDHARSLAVCSTKSMTGHTLGAAGGIESVAVVLSLTHDVLAPTINLDNPDEGFDLDFVPHEAREKKINYALNNSFGFGGHNVCLVFGRYNGD